TTGSRLRSNSPKIFQDIKGDCWNTSLLQVFANCEHYITMNGGYSILVSLFGGTNIIYSTKRGNYGCHEIEHRSFARWYPNHADQRTVFVENYDALKEKVSAIYIEKLPTANILVRTAGRPRAFKIALQSIACQTYRNINLIVTVDDSESIKYTRGLDARIIDLSHINCDNKRHEDRVNYGIPFKYNLYIKEVLNRLHEGYFFYIDDDDMFTSKYSVEHIMSNVEENKLLVWKVDMNDNRILPGKSFGKEIKLYDITGIGFAHHVKHKELTDWSEWKRADYRTAKKLSDNLPVKWLDAILTKIQGSPGMGRRNDIVPTNKGYMKTVKVINPIIGKVGCIKRLPKPIAAEMVAKGYAEYLSDVVDNLNKPVEVIGKPIVTENKQVNPVEENKKVKENDPKPTANSNKRVRATRTVKSKNVSKAKQ
ncbi:MAG TPA: glycosyltransferase family A protein, partial [Tenuifilaceae bacterium]|nr:glycosyltransferase family A protein [Tenuifilaceae bacterium]